MRKQGDSTGPIPEALQGKTCPFCGGDTYQLVLDNATASDDSSLLVRCHRCSRPKNLSGDFRSVLWI